MSILEAIILAIVEGLTEFLPVSSTGHMIIASSIMGIASDPFTKLFTVAIQLGAILSVMVLYLRKFLPDKNHSIKQTFQFYVKLTIAVLPAGIIGYLFEKHIDALLENVIVVGISLIVGGIIFLFLDKFFNKNEHLEEEEEISYQSSFKIGLFQTLAMVPGDQLPPLSVGSLRASVNVPPQSSLSSWPCLRCLALRWLNYSNTPAHSVAMKSNC
jgi:undecaprenyl-diphosphatase